MTGKLGVDDFPVGSIVKTPTGRIGKVVKHRGAESRRDCYERLVIRFSIDPSDLVALQPHLVSVADVDARLLGLDF